MSPLQAMVNGMSAQWQRERSETQMTLGGLIATLDAVPPDMQVANLRNLDSYRGYYSDLYFELHKGTRSAIDLLNDCRGAMGKVFVGYKGGEYQMGERTPLWIATYGCCGDKLMQLNADGTIITAPDNE